MPVGMGLVVDRDVALSFSRAFTDWGEKGDPAEDWDEDSQLSCRDSADSPSAVGLTVAFDVVAVLVV
jgi:hypothetical protein